jgi:hypothetical protein
MDIEIDFDDVSLEPTLPVDGVIDAPQKTPEPEPVNTDPAPEPKKRGPKPKVKDEPTPGATAEPDPTSTTAPDADPEPEPEPTGDEENFILSMAKKIGIELPEGVEFEDSEDGLIEFNEYVADLRADEKLNGFFENLPPVAGDFFDYLQMLGEDATEDKIKAFFTSVNPEIDYKSVDLESEDVQKAVMKTFFKKMDYTDDEIKDAIDDMEIANTLSKQAKVASQKLASMQEKDRAGLIEKQRQEAQIKKEQTQKFFGSVKQILDSGKVNNFTIPVTERKALFEYDANGQLAKDLNDILKDPTKRVELAIAVKNKFNLNKYIQAAAATQKVNSLRDKVKAGTMKGAASYGGVVNSDIDWDATT